MTKLPSNTPIIDPRWASAYEDWLTTDDDVVDESKFLRYMNILDDFMQPNGFYSGPQLMQMEATHTTESKTAELTLLLHHAHKTPPQGVTPETYTFDSLYYDSRMLVLARESVRRGQPIQPVLLIRAKELIAYVFKVCSLNEQFLNHYHQQRMNGEVVWPAPSKLSS